MYPDHPNLLPAYFDDDPKAATIGGLIMRPVLLAYDPKRGSYCHHLLTAESHGRRAPRSNPKSTRLN
jgi:hypothetical protein